MTEPRASHGDPHPALSPSPSERDERAGFEKWISRVFGWYPRTRQSRELIVVPVAMLEEARDSLPGGDARGCIEIMLNKGIRI